MAGRIGRLVKVDDSRAHVLLDLSRQRSTSVRNGRVVRCANEHYLHVSCVFGELWEELPPTVAVVLEQQRPIAGVDGRRRGRWLDHIRVGVGLHESHGVK